MAWTLRLRGAKNGATNVELPHGATTSLQELKAAVATAVGEDAGTLVIKAGFPPRELSEDGGPYAAVSALGVVDKDTLVLDRRPGTSEKNVAKTKARPSKRKDAPAETSTSPSRTTVTKSGRKTTCTSEKMASTLKEMQERETFAAGKSAKRAESSGSASTAAAKAALTRKFNQAGPGYSLRDDQGPSTGGASSAGAASTASQSDASSPSVSAVPSASPAAPRGGGASSSRGSGRSNALISNVVASGLQSLGTEDANIGAAQSDVSADLVSAFEPGRSKNPMRVALREARSKQGAIELATAREAAAMQGKYQFLEKQVGIQGNKVVTVLEVRWTNGNKEMSETIANFSREVVKAILSELLRSDQPEFRVNIKPHNMACVSPRVFWNVVRHCQVGPDKEFAAALTELLPDQPWEILLSRNQEGHTEGRFRH